MKLNTPLSFFSTTFANQARFKEKPGTLTQQNEARGSFEAEAPPSGLHGATAAAQLNTDVPSAEGSSGARLRAPLKRASTNSPLHPNNLGPAAFAAKVRSCAR